MYLRTCSKLVILVLCILASPALHACNIVYGADWAFVLEPPHGWNIVCGTNALEGTAVTLWPAASSTRDAKSLLYVSVSKKEPQPLQAFAGDEQDRFKARVPSLRVLPIELPSSTAESSKLAFQFSPDAPARQEYIAYIEGPTAYFILVLTSTDAGELARQRQAFFSAIKSFVPMKRE